MLSNLIFDYFMNFQNPFCAEKIQQNGAFEANIFFKEMINTSEKILIFYLQQNFARKNNNHPCHDHKKCNGKCSKGLV